jgi:folate-binding protein YgfZ
MPSPALAARTLIFEGPDAGSFAQAQLSSDVRALQVGHWQWSGWLDAQGRVRALLQLARLDEDRYLLLLRGGDADRMAEGLRRFVFRAKVRIDVPPARRLLDGDALGLGHVSEADGDIRIGMGAYSTVIGERDSDDAQAWRAKNIEDGYPWLPDDAIDALLPPALSMERLHAVSFGKGCFPGQEIVARLRYRGGHKRHLCRVELSQAVDVGSTLVSSEKDCGIVLDVVTTDGNTTALAVVADDAVERAPSQPITVAQGNVSARVTTTLPA